MKNNGFTLIEIIVSLILVGIIALFAGMGLVRSVESYVFSRDTVALAEKASLAMTRIVLELKFIETITKSENDTMEYTSSRGDGTQSYQLMRNAANELVIDVGNSNNYILIDNLGTYPSGTDFLSYKENDGASWTSGVLSDLAYIEIVLVLKKSDASNVEYRTFVDMRNNHRANAILPDI